MTAELSPTTRPDGRAPSSSEQLPVGQEQTQTERHASEFMARALAKIKVLSGPAAQRRLDAQNRQRREEQIADLRTRMNCPQRQLANRAQLDWSGPWGTKTGELLERIGTGFLIGLNGRNGTGKTQIVIELLCAQTERLRSARYATATEFFMELKRAYSTEGAWEGEVIAEFTRPAFLALDEMSKRRESEWENQLLFELIDRRFRAMKDTMLISNHDRVAFRQALGPSLCSRMVEAGGFVECNWASFRRAGGA